jgi:hypothetical protein
MREGRRLAAPVAGQDHVLGEERFEAADVTVAGRSEEAARELVALLARGGKARPSLVDVAPGARGELADVGLALAHDLADLRVLIIEDIVEQEHGSLLGREGLEEHEHCHRE